MTDHQHALTSRDATISQVDSDFLGAPPHLAARPLALLGVDDRQSGRVFDAKRNELQPKLIVVPGQLVQGGLRRVRKQGGVSASRQLERPNGSASEVRWQPPWRDKARPKGGARQNTSKSEYIAHSQTLTAFPSASTIPRPFRPYEPRLGSLRLPTEPHNPSHLRPAIRLRRVAQSVQPISPITPFTLSWTRSAGP